MRKAAGCVLLAILCLLGASYLPRILQEAQTDREQQNLISGYIQNPDTTDEENTESTTDEPEEETDPNMERIVDFQNLQQINPEILAWITVPGTPIDYPVALGEDNSYYLNHTVTGESNILGSIFATAGTDFEESHIILYGHNMASGKMFGRYIGRNVGITRMGRTSSYSWYPYYNGISIWYGCDGSKSIWILIVGRT